MAMLLDAEPMPATKQQGGDAESLKLTGLRCRWLDWAAAQIDAALAIDLQATENLLAALRSVCAQPQSPVNIDVTGIVGAIQSHDRLVQQLNHLASALRSLGAFEYDHPAASDTNWSELRRRQLRAFSMSSERALFRRMIPDLCGDDTHADIEHGGSGAVELF